MRATPAAQRVSGYIGAAALLASLPPTRALLADGGYDADWLRDALADRGAEACIPSKSNRNAHILHGTERYPKRHTLLGYLTCPSRQRIEYMFFRSRDWRRIHTRYGRCAHTFMSAIAIAAFVPLGSG